MQNQITVDQIHEFANKQNILRNSLESEENREFFNALNDQHGPQAVDHFKDNLALTYYGYQVDSESDDASTDEIQRVYSAAKVIFARHPNKVFEFDIESAYSGIGSPWVRQCSTPEEWVICWARRYLETDEGSIDFVDQSILVNVLELINDLIWVGVPQGIIDENLSYICYANEDLIKRAEFN